MDNIIGSNIDGRYRVVALLGSGGLGSVYRAEQDELKRSVAIKVLNANAVEDQENRVRFEREARVLAGLHHENIVGVYSYGTLPDHKPYIAMELLEGQPLSDVLRGGALPWKRAVLIAIQICEAMSAAHKMGVIHRDIKPQNIMLIGNSDLVKVLDFGLSKVSQADITGQKLTQTGLLIGSIHYMSPEVCMGRPAGNASDVYSLGCVLYECLSGKPPFDYDNPIGMLHKHCTEMPPALQTDPGQDGSIPVELSLLVFKALQKAPEERFANMDDFAQSLKSVAEGTALQLTFSNIKLPERPAVKRPKKTIPVALGALAVALAITPALLKNRVAPNTEILATSQANTPTNRIMKAHSLLREARAAATIGKKHKAEVSARTAITTLGTVPDKETLNRDDALKVADLIVELHGLYEQRGLRGTADISRSLTAIQQQVIVSLDIQRKAKFMTALASLSACYPSAAPLTAERNLNAMIFSYQAGDLNRAQHIYDGSHAWNARYLDNSQVDCIDRIELGYLELYKGHRQKAIEVADQTRKFLDSSFEDSYHSRIEMMIRLFGLEQEIGDKKRVLSVLQEIEGLIKQVERGGFGQPIVHTTFGPGTLEEKLKKEAGFHRDNLVVACKTQELINHVYAACP